MATSIRAATGDANLIKTVRAGAALIDPSSLTSIGILLDSDRMQPPAARYAVIRDGLRAKGFPSPDDPAIVSPSRPRPGTFVLPDNRSPGTLVDILIDCGR